MKRLLLSFMLFMLVPLPVMAAEIYSKVPQVIDPSAHYVFYMHGGRIPEGATSYEHTLWGVHDVPKISKALQDDGYHLISYVRPYDMKDVTSAERLVLEVRKLMKAGVKAEQITLVGFSFGAVVVVIAASNLEEPGLNIALLAGCAGRVMWEPSLAVWGRVLSLYDEADDHVASCKVLKERGGSISQFEETIFKTDKGHALFFLPDDVWVKPLKNWINKSQ